MRFPHFQVELLSRQVMRIVIPKGVYSLNGKVDVHIATPYGVSPHLEIPILCDMPAAEAPTNLLNLASTALTIRCSWVRDKLDPAGGHLQPSNWEPGTLKLQWAGAKDLAPQTLALQFSFDTPKGRIEFDKVKAIAQGREFDVPTSDVIDQLLKRLGDLGKYKPGDNLPGTLTGTIMVLRVDNNPIFESIGQVPQPLTVSLELVAPPSRQSVPAPP